MLLEKLIWSGFIGAVCYLAEQELPFRDHDGSSALYNIGYFLEFLNVLKNFDQVIENHMNSSTVI